MTEYKVKDPAEVSAALAQMQAGDVLAAASFRSLARSGRELAALARTLRDRQLELVSAGEDVDTRRADDSFFRVCAGLEELDRLYGVQRRREGIEKAKEDGRYKGRKPIAVDETLFDAVAARWERGEITAREAMSRLELKPNTFYRRIKEREENKMKEYKQVEKEIRQELRDSGRQARETMRDLKKQVHSEAKEVKKAAEEKLDLHEVEREIRKDRIRAELEHKDELRQMKKDVEAEAAQLKTLLEGDKE